VSVVGDAVKSAKKPLINKGIAETSGKQLQRVGNFWCDVGARHIYVDEVQNPVEVDSVEAIGDRNDLSGRRNYDRGFRRLPLEGLGESRGR
jgi:hypothetical protein